MLLLALIFRWTGEPRRPSDADWGAVMVATLMVAVASVILAPWLVWHAAACAGGTLVRLSWVGLAVAVGVNLWLFLGPLAGLVWAAVAGVSAFLVILFTADRGVPA